MMRLALACAALVAMTGQAASHDWFSSKNNTDGLGRCCGGGPSGDCAEVPLAMIESGAVQPTQTGFSVVLSVPEAQHFNKRQNKAIRQEIPWKEVQPSESRDPNGSGYALCILADRVRCFFAPQSAMLKRATLHMVAML